LQPHSTANHIFYNAGVMNDLVAGTGHTTARLFSNIFDTMLLTDFVPPKNNVAVARRSGSVIFMNQQIVGYWQKLLGLSELFICELLTQHCHSTPMQYHVNIGLSEYIFRILSGNGTASL
jgi:hypothetical protein